MKTFRHSLVATLPLALSITVMQKAGWTQTLGNPVPISVPHNTMELLRKALKNGTPSEKEVALDVIRDLKPIQLIPDIIEAIEDSTPLPRHEDTGWGFVGHQAATVMGEIARAVDNVDVKIRGNDSNAYSFFNDQSEGGQKLKELGRLSEVRSNWAKWWDSHRNQEIVSDASGSATKETTDDIVQIVLWPSNLSTLKSIPSSDVIEKVELNASLNEGYGSKLDEQSFKKLMDTAKPLDANVPKIQAWQYAPWYSGSFVVKTETYYFGLYFGGMGMLLTPKKEKGMFMFEHKPEVKK